MALLKRRVKVFIEGRVQGVGFRPSVFKYAVENRLTGFVCNTADGLYIEVEGFIKNIEKFIEKIKRNPPVRAHINKISVIYTNPINSEKTFRIIGSRYTSEKIKIELSPDIAICNECLKELFNPEDRRYLFPFINCTNCGPRFTITEKLPYDRENTTMKIFKMCPECLKEYNNPADRRFHAQPDCCFVCGPDVFLIKDEILAKGIEAIKRSAELINKGYIVAVKGTGGYHLICDAKNSKIVNRLREIKNRGDKPFALMAKDIKTAKQYCFISSVEKKLLVSWQSPIVLLKKKENCTLPEEIAPSNRYLGFFLPYTPVHHLLFFFNCPDVVVATSANIADSPIIFKDNKKEMEKLTYISDYILTNNRPIKTGCDDSVVRVAPDKNIYMIRKARGYTPDMIKTAISFKKEVFAAGAEEKNTFAFGRDNSIILSQHTGNQEDAETLNFYYETFEHFVRIFGFSPEIVAHDLHPDYLPTKFALDMAKRNGLKTIGIQHHHAHIASCMLDNNLKNEKVIGVALDGTGYGEKGDIRGAEFLIADYRTYERYAYLDYITLPGGEKAIKEVWRIGLSLLYKTFGNEIFNLKIPFIERYRSKTEFILDMFKKDINCVPVSSMGRLFDGVSSILGISENITYEAQPAIELEMIAKKTEGKPYKYGIREESSLIIDLLPLIKSIVDDIKSGISTEKISYKFHRTISAIITRICKRIKEERGIYRVVLSGGVFQNKLLLDIVWKELQENNFSVFCHHNLPTNDGCISAGQSVIALYSQYRE
ncbi:MAG: carbamoyltransferase HypF [bacterium]|nr:carbamoyltransferase HypF [bacterium]